MITTEKPPSPSSSTKRSSLTNPETDATITAAQALLTEFTNLPLYIRNSKSQYDEALKKLPDYDINGRKKPIELERDLQEQISFVRKLKTHYIEQTAKDKYVKTILDDDAPIITLEDNLALRKVNEEKKAKLKEAKDTLKKSYDKVGKLADEVEEDYNKAKEYSTETSAILQDILDKHLQLSRLRAAHPLPRLTLSSAQAKLESQEEEMAQCDATLSRLNAEVEEMKEKLKESAREVERLKIEKAKIEEEVRRCKEGREEEDEGVADLYEWYSMSLALHRSLFSIYEIKPISANELALTYHIDRAPSPNPAEVNKPVPITISLIFHPHTRQLADARITTVHPGAKSINTEDLVGSYTPSNDVSGLVRAILSRVRYEVRERHKDTVLMIEQ